MSNVSGSNAIPGSGLKPRLTGFLPVIDGLRQRILSAIVMIAVSVGATLAGSLPFAILLLVIALLVSLEWGQLVGSRGLAFAVHAAAVAAAVILSLLGFPLLACLAVFAGAIVLAGGAYGPNPLLSAAGVLYAGIPVVALFWFRADPAYGLMAVLFLFLMVWTNDTMAFVVGKSIGRIKLWPSISPKKTWEGFAGGIFFSGLAGCLFAFALPGASPVRLAVIGGLLGAVAVAGDLAESALKRRFGVKDTGAMIPGHGGVMDRMDGIVAVAVVAAVAALAIGGRSPSMALLVGG